MITLNGSDEPAKPFDWDKAAADYRDSYRLRMARLASALAQPPVKALGTIGGARLHTR